MTNVLERATHWHHREVLDPSGDKIGTVEQVWFADDDTGPSWISVKTGLFGLRQSFVPIEGLTEGAGGELRTPYAKEQVKDAPSVDASDDHLDSGEELRLYEHYGLGSGQHAGHATHRTGDRTAVDRTATDRAAAERTATRARQDTSRTDDAMTRSEEHLRVGTERHGTGRARLRKYVTTETEQVSVPVSREQVRVEREPITDANRGEALSGPAISEAEHEVTLHEERPVVDREAVPVERVRLAKEQVRDTETVSGEVRRERVETEGDVPGRDRRSR